MPPNLALSLLQASDWFNDALAERMAQRGFPRLSRSQALVLTTLQRGPCRPVDLARQLQVTRQAMQQLMSPLTEHGLVELRPDPADGRALLAHLTPEAEPFGMAAGAELTRVEAELRRRIGDRAVDQMTRALELDWGPPPTD